MRHHSTPHTIASTGTVLSVSQMRVSEAWRLEAVWDREARDGGYERSRPRKERSFRRASSTWRMSVSICRKRCSISSSE